MFKYSKKYRIKIALIMLLTISLSIISAKISVISKQIVDIASNKENLDQLFQVSIFLLEVYFIITICSIINSYLSSKYSINLDADVKVDFFKQIQKASYLFSRKNNAGEVYYRMFKDINVISDYFNKLIINFSTNVITIVILIRIMLGWSKILTLFTIVMCTLQLVIMYILRLPVLKMVKELRNTEQGISSYISENFSIIETIKTLGIEQHRLDKFKKVINKYKNNSFKYTFVCSLVQSVSSLISQFWSIGILLIGSYLYFNNLITIGTIIAFFSLSNMVYTPISSCVGIILSYQELKVSFERYCEYKNEYDDVSYSGTKDFNFNSSIKFKNLSFAYKDNSSVLNNVNLEIPKNSVVCIIGDNGSGKSTLVKLFLRLLHQEEGSIEIDDVNINDIDIEQFRQNVAFIPQRPVIFNGTLRYNITLDSQEYTNNNVLDVITECNLDELLWKLINGLDTELGTKGDLVSGGEVQKIALARILIKKPKVIILDEHNSSLDRRTNKMIMKFLIKYKEKNNTTMIMISHMRNIIEKADKVYNLNCGIISQETIE